MAGVEDYAVTSKVGVTPGVWDLCRLLRAAIIQRVCRVRVGEVRGVSVAMTSWRNEMIFCDRNFFVDSGVDEALTLYSLGMTRPGTSSMKPGHLEY